MIENAILIRYGELFLKGKNKNFFEKSLINNIKNNLKDIDCKLNRTSGRYYITEYSLDDEDAIIDVLTKTFGIYSVSPCVMMDTDFDAIEKYIEGLKFYEKSFRVSVKRGDKTFKMNSSQFSAYIGGVVLKSNPNMEVDLNNYDLNINIDIRENKKTFIFYKNIECAKGMPVGTSGKGLLFLSGGIDSPVAGYMMAKRGMKLNALHFHSYPYTSIQAKEKVITLAKKLATYNGNFKLFVCSFTKIQEAIHKFCAEEFMITIMRRIMMRIGEKLCEKFDLQTIITGESLGQVASQTIESLTVTNGVVKNIPVLRPLIGFDKEEITFISKKMDAFETSILPYEDCCTVFLPKHPLIKPKLEKVLIQESNLDIDALVEDALNTIEIIDIKR